MPKIELLISVESIEGNISYKTTGIIQEDVLKYKEPNNTTAIYNFSKNSLIRDNKELKMFYTFNEKDETIGLIRIKDLNKDMNVPIQTREIIKANNDVTIEFIIDNYTFKYRIEEIK